MKHYKAPWSPLLVILSTLLTAWLLGQAFVEFRHRGAASWVGWLLVALVVGCAFFTIRGYTVTPDAILVHRLVWNTRLPLAGLQSARVERKPRRWGIRIGNGGFFSFSGFLRCRLRLCHFLCRCFFFFFGYFFCQLLAFVIYRLQVL